MNIGRLNIITGGVFILLGGFGGIALGFTVDAYFEGGSLSIPLGRALLRSSHSHGLSIAFYNIIIGLLVDRLVMDNKWKKICSVMSILSVGIPIGLFLRGLAGGTETFIPVIIIGALCFLSSAAIMIKGALFNN